MLAVICVVAMILQTPCISSTADDVPFRDLVVPEDRYMIELYGKVSRWQKCLILCNVCYCNAVR